MDKQCTICGTIGKYKCPTCLIYYCSVECCKRHRASACDVLIKNDEVATTSNSKIGTKYASADTVPMEKLMLLRTDDSLNNLLCNPHLRALLTKVNSSSDPEKIMEKAMLEPLFIEFADACLNIVEPARSDD